MLKLKRWFWTKYYEFEYRKVDDNLCCCGESDCNGDSSHSPVNAKNYAINRDVNSRLIVVNPKAANYASKKK